MKTIRSNTTSELTIKNSRFITLLLKISSQDNISQIIEKAKKEYPKANHYCYAYITENEKKSSDDKEPGGTAGMPMLNILEKEQIINVIAITIRYFGGIKLGAGGLVRAYSKSVKNALNCTEKIELELGYQILLITSYDNQKNLDYLLRNYHIISKEYQEQVKYVIDLPQDKLDILSNYQYQIIKKYYIEKVHV